MFRFRPITPDAFSTVVLLHQEYRVVREICVQVIDVIRDVDNAAVLQEANKAPDLAGESPAVRLVAGKTLTMATVLLETSNDSVVDRRYGNPLKLYPIPLASQC